MANLDAQHTDEVDARWKGDKRVSPWWPLLLTLVTLTAPPAIFVHFVAPPVDAVSSEDLAGRPYLIVFGFTHCPDVCPTTLAELSALTQDLRETGRSIRQVFVTVDPERDTPEVLRDYLSSFGDDVVGLTGGPDEVAAMAKRFRVHTKRVPLGDGDYTMEHSAGVFLVDASGRLTGALPQDRGAALKRLETAIDDTPRLIASSGRSAAGGRSPLMAELLGAKPLPGDEQAFCSAGGRGGTR